MKIDKAVTVTRKRDIPSPDRHGGRRSKEYDALAERVLKLAADKAVRVECDTLNAAYSLIICMKRRSKSIGAQRRESTVYLFNLK